MRGPSLTPPARSELGQRARSCPRPAARTSVDDHHVDAGRTRAVAVGGRGVATCSARRRRPPAARAPSGRWPGRAWPTSPWPSRPPRPPCSPAPSSAARQRAVAVRDDGRRDPAFGEHPQRRRGVVEGPQHDASASTAHACLGAGLSPSSQQHRRALSPQLRQAVASRPCGSPPRSARSRPGRHSRRPLVDLDAQLLAARAARSRATGRRARSACRRRPAARARSGIGLVTSGWIALAILASDSAHPRAVLIQHRVRQLGDRCLLHGRDRAGGSCRRAAPSGSRPARSPRCRHRGQLSPARRREPLRGVRPRRPRCCRPPARSGRRASRPVRSCRRSRRSTNIVRRRLAGHRLLTAVMRLDVWRPPRAWSAWSVISPSEVMSSSTPLTDRRPPRRRPHHLGLGACADALSASAWSAPGSRDQHDVGGLAEAP